jgi:parallel beta-helix repeat protein
LLTVNEAISRAKKQSHDGTAVTVKIHPGTYREKVDIYGSSANEGDITIRGTGSGATISGSDIWTGWRQTELSDIYDHGWIYNWGESALPSGWGSVADMPGIIRRREMVFANEVGLKEVQTWGELMNEEGTFWASESENVIRVHLTGDRDPNKTKMEVALRPHLLLVKDWEGFTIENLDFRHAASPITSSAATFADSSGIHVLDSSFQWNNTVGLYFYASGDITVEGTSANYNGIGGMGGGYIDDALFTDTQTSYNNWRGSRGWDLNNHSNPVDQNFIDFSTGQKFVSVRNLTFRRHVSTGNLTGGLWFDHDNRDVLLDEVELSNNLTHGVFVEATQGPFEIVDSRVCNNESGVLLANSSDGAIKNNVISGNTLGQVTVGGTVPEPRTVTDRETGARLELQSKSWSIEGNTFAAGPDQLGLSAVLGLNWDLFVETLKSDDNRWFHSSSPDIFGLIRGGERIDFDDWQLTTGHDKNSIGGQGGSACPPPTQRSVASSPSSAGRILIPASVLVVLGLLWARRAFR